jgi:hypothetical protein
MPVEERSFPPPWTIEDLDDFPPERGDKDLKSVATRGALISKSRGRGPFLAIFQTDYGHLVGCTRPRGGGADAEDGGEAPHSRRDWVEGSCGKAIPCCEGS